MSPTESNVFHRHGQDFSQSIIEIQTCVWKGQTIAHQDLAGYTCISIKNFGQVKNMVFIRTWTFPYPDASDYQKRFPSNNISRVKNPPATQMFRDRILLVSVILAISQNLLDPKRTLIIASSNFQNGPLHKHQFTSGLTTHRLASEIYIHCGILAMSSRHGNQLNCLFHTIYGLVMNAKPFTYFKLICNIQLKKWTGT